MIERAAAKRLDWATASLIVILPVAAALRFSGIGSGIPYAIGVDEPQLVNRAVIMIKTGDFNPHFFDYPSFAIYVQTVTAIARYIVGALNGRWAGLQQFPAAECYLWGRAVTATIGTATIALVYVCGREWGRGPAVLAAALMAVMPLHVRESHYVLTDVPLTFFVVLVLWLSMRAHRRPGAAAFAWAGAAAGLAAATKYPGAVAIVMPLCAAALIRDARPSSRPALITSTIGGAAVAFLLAAPYTLLDLPGFLNGFGRLAAMYAPSAGQPAWLVYLKHLRNALAWPATIAAIAGVAAAVREALRGPHRVPAILGLLFTTLYFVVLARQSGLVFGRYLLPIAPFVCLFVAAAAAEAPALLIRTIAFRPRPRAALAIAVAVLILLMPAMTSAAFDASLRKTSTSEMAYDWLVMHASKTDPVVVECADLSLAYGPFRWESVRELRLKSIEQYRAAGVTYLVASSSCYGPYLRNPGSPEAADYSRLFGAAHAVATFTGSSSHPGPDYRILKVS